MNRADYKSAGVDISAGNQAVARIKTCVEATFSPQVLTSIGSFGALYDLADIIKQYDQPVLVQSIDGVGTKIMVAKMMQKFDTIGIDLVSATTNDIIVLGAKPLTLLDYIANDKLNPQVIAEIVGGMARACQENGIALVGGETAEMPGVYLPGEHDLVGVITGVVERDQAILGKEIKPGDIVCALPSSGLHTNGFSLVRKLFFDLHHYKTDTVLPDYGAMLGEVLLTPHLNYTRPILALLAAGISIKGMAHITGGGLLENVPRILPPGCAVDIEKNSWPRQPIFTLLQALSRLDDCEIYRTFNMGIGLVLIVAPAVVSKVKAQMLNFTEFPVFEIGVVTKGQPSVRLV